MKYAYRYLQHKDNIFFLYQNIFNSKLCIFATKRNKTHVPFIEIVFCGNCNRNSCAEVREVVMKAHPDYNVNLVFEQEDSTDDEMITVIGNRYLLSIAFANLIENNCKYSENHTSFVQISFWDKWSIIRLSDDGRGMSDKDKEQIFNLFYRGESSDNTEGHGIGMTLAHKIVSLHDGRLSVYSQPGEGTTFIIELPHV